MKYYFIYKTIDTKNNKIYVGKHTTDNIDDGYLGSGKIIKNKIKKYGKSYFRREILEHCTEHNINDREIYWIDKLNSMNENIGYNLSLGGTGGNNVKWTVKNRKEHSEKLKDDRCKGPKSEEHKRNIGLANKDKLLSNKHKKSISEFQKIYNNKKEVIERKRKVRGIPICIDGVKYLSIRHASVELGLSKTTVNNRLKRGEDGYKYL